MMRERSPENYSSIVEMPWKEVRHFFDTLSIQEANELFLSELESGKQDSNLLELYYLYLNSKLWFDFPVELGSGLILPGGRLLPIGFNSGHIHGIRKYFALMKIQFHSVSKSNENDKFIDSGGVIISSTGSSSNIIINQDLYKTQPQKVQNAVDFCLASPNITVINVCIPGKTYCFKSDILRSVPFRLSLPHTFRV